MEAWIKLLQTYGPFALLVLLIFVVERKVWGEMKDQKEHVAVRWVYGGTWTFIFMMCAVIVAVWVHDNVKAGEHTVRGRIEGLRETQLLTSKDMYTRRDYVDEEKHTYDLAFRITGDKEATKAKFSLGDKDLGDADYELPIEASYFDQNKDLVLSYQSKKHTFALAIASGNLELKPIDDLGSTLPDAPAQLAILDRLLGILPVYASDAKPRPLSAGTLDRLDSLDPTLRSDARIDLSRAGKQSAPYIASVLYDPGSSTRQLLGVLAVLNNSKTLASDMFGTLADYKAAQCTIVRLSQGDDGPLKNEANKYLAAHDGASREKACQPIAGRTFACKDALTVRLASGGGLQRITVGNQRAYLWQQSLSLDANNKSTLYIIVSQSPDWPITRKLGADDAKPLLAKLQESTGPKLQPESYYKKVVVNGETVAVTLPGGKDLKVFVKETKSTESRTDFQVCLP